MGIAAGQTENSFITDPIIYGQSVRQSTIYSFVCLLNSVCKIVVLCLFHSSHSVEKYKIGYSITDQAKQCTGNCNKDDCDIECHKQLCGQNFQTTGSTSKCSLDCNSKEIKCEQNCNHGECDMKCHGQHCEQTCNSGANNCSLQCPMTSKQVCKQICNHGECDMKCHGQHCEQTCNSEGNKCSLQCLMINQVCKQICNHGDCTLECHGSGCDQQCNGNQQSCQLKCPVANDSDPCELNYCFADESKCTTTATASKKTTLVVALTTASQSPCRHYSMGKWLNK